MDLHLVTKVPGFLNRGIKSTTNFRVHQVRGVLSPMCEVAPYYEIDTGYPNEHMHHELMRRDVR